MRKCFDVVIAGGGAMGSSAAYWLKVMNPALQVCIVERDPSYKQASTSLSVGSFRQQFSLVENIQLSMSSTKFIREEMRTALAVEGDPEPNIGVVEGGYLLLASNKNGEENMRENYYTQRSLQAKVRLLDPEKLAECFPWINAEDIRLASHGYENEGWFDPYALLYLLKRKALSLGVHYIKDQVCGFTLNTNSQRIDKVKLLSSSTALGCGTVINTTGPWAAETAAMAGVQNFPVRPRKRYVFQFHCPNTPANVTFPLTVDPTGMYFRSDGATPHHFLCGMSPEIDVDWDAKEDAELAVDHDFFHNTIWPLLYHRVPAFANLKVKASWAGLYEYNTLDQNAIVGPHLTVSNLLFANGFSGHGIQQSIAVGRALAELVIFNEYRTIDLSRLGYSRIAANVPLFERCIV